MKRPKVQVFTRWQRRTQNQSYAVKEEKDQVERPHSWLPAMIMQQEIKVFFPVSPAGFKFSAWMSMKGIKDNSIIS